MFEYPLSLNISVREPFELILLFTVYKHLNILETNLLWFAAFRNIQQRRPQYPWD